MTNPVDPAEITAHVLRSPGVEVHLLSIGCAVQTWMVDGVPVVLGYAEPSAYVANPVSMGVVIGRVANRISNARLEIGGQRYDLSCNHGDHCIHGGSGGFGWRNWKMTPLSDTSALFSLVSPDGDQGFPGRVQVEVEMRLDGRALIYEIAARAERTTPINLAQHQYFNLMGAGEVLDHQLRIDADLFTPTGPDYRPTGAILPVDGTGYDYRQARRLGQADPTRAGCDASLILRDVTGPQIFLTAPSGLGLRMTTDRPCVQLYTAGGLGPAAPAGPGAAHVPFGAVCLEAQDYPDALAQGFPVTLFGPGVTYRQRTVIEIG